MNNSTFSCVLFIAIIAFIAYLFYRRKKITDDLQDFYKQGNYTRRESVPVANPFIYTDMSFVVCSDGFLKKDFPYTLMLGTRFTGAGRSRIQDDYIGFYIPTQSQLTDEWLKKWKQKVAERGDGWSKHSDIEPMKKSWGLRGAPQSLPIRASRVQGGIVLAWIGLHLRKNIEAHIQEVLDSLK